MLVLALCLVAMAPLSFARLCTASAGDDDGANYSRVTSEIVISSASRYQYQMIVMTRR